MRNLKNVIGCDESGFGGKGGKLVGACAITIGEINIPSEYCQIKDSKLLTKKQLKRLVTLLKTKQQIFYAVSKIKVKKITDWNQAWNFVMLDSYKKLIKNSPQFQNYPVIIDGQKRPSGLEQAGCMPRGDRQLIPIALAGIFATYTRKFHR